MFLAVERPLAVKQHSIVGLGGHASLLHLGLGSPGNGLSLIVPSWVILEKLRNEMLHGTTTIAFKFLCGFIVAADSQAPGGVYIASWIEEKVKKINPNLLGTMTGVAVDFSFWERLLECISVPTGSKLLANTVYQHKGLGLSKGTMICGWGKRGSGLHCMDTEGDWILGAAFSVGSGSLYAYEVTDQSYSYDLEVEQAYDLAYAYSGGSVNVYHVWEGGWIRISRYSVANLHDNLVTLPQRRVDMAVCLSWGACW
uniref:Uncharacterized protein n=1 Tax=Catagonus wagneri TaxID=51154 RepID=A0A8C3WHU8_9CETA